MDYFWQCSCLETNPCVLVFTISLTLEEAVTSAEFGSFYGLVRTKKSMNRVYKTNIGRSFIREMVEIYCTLGKIQPGPTIHLGPTGLGDWIVGQGWISPRRQ